MPHPSKCPYCQVYDPDAATFPFCSPECRAGYEADHCGRSIRIRLLTPVKV